MVFICSLVNSLDFQRNKYHYIDRSSWHILRASVSNYTGTNGYTDQLAARVTRLEQQITLPIYLSAEANVFLTLCTTVLPAVTGLLLYRFVVMPRRKAKKIA